MANPLLDLWITVAVVSQRAVFRERVHRGAAAQCREMQGNVILTA
jgi:hypothetical protein